MHNQRALRLEMVNRVSHLMVYCFGAIAAFEALLIIQWVTLDSLWESILRPSLLLTILAIIFWIAMFFTIRYVKRAFVFYAYLTVGSMAFCAVVIIELILLATIKLGNTGWGVIALVTIWLLIGFYKNYTRELRVLSVTEESITKPGRLDMEKGTWDISANYSSEGRKDITKPRIGLEILLWVAGLLLFLFLGSFFGDPLILAVVLVSIWGWMLIGVGDYLAYTAQLLSWEKDVGRKITLAVQGDVLMRKK